MADHPQSIADILRPLRFLEQVSLMTEPPDLDRARAKVELVDGAISMRVLKPVQRNRAGSLLKNIGSALGVMGLSADQLTSMLMFKVVAAFEGPPS
jgi:hypothetical protein